MKYTLILLIANALYSCDNNKAENTGMEGKAMPSFKLLLSDSITYFDTKAIPAGKPSVLFYYGPNCPYSRNQMSDMISDINSLKNLQLYIFTAAPFNEMKEFNSHFQLKKYPNVLSGQDFSYFFSGYFSPNGVPYTAIYGGNKKLLKAFKGKIDVKDILNTIK